MDIGLDQDVHAADRVEWDLIVFVVPPVPHFSHILSTSVELLVTYTISVTAQRKGCLAAMGQAQTYPRQ